MKVYIFFVNKNVQMQLTLSTNYLRHTQLTVLVAISDKRTGHKIISNYQNRTELKFLYTVLVEQQK